MIITRTPLRVAIGGGGTDLPSYYSRRGGFFISAAINQYIYIGMQRTFTREIILKYSEMERVQNISDIKHDIIREALKNFDVAQGFEMASFADIPAGTGMGSSGSFTVGFLKGLSALDNKSIPHDQLARDASELVMKKLNRPDGFQDQYTAAYGGINCYTIDTAGTIVVEPLKLSGATLNALRDRLALFFTGFYRQAGEILSQQKEKTELGDAEVLTSLDKIKELGLIIKAELERGNPDAFGEVMREHWEQKKKRSPDMTNSLINQWYETALKNGASGGKVIGAGGGGFLLFYTKDKEKLLHEMTSAGLTHVRFDFDFEGSSLLVKA